MKKQAQKKFYKKKITVTNNEKIIFVQPTLTSDDEVDSATLSRIIVPPVILMSILLITLSAFIFLQLQMRLIRVPKRDKSYQPLAYPVITNKEIPVISAQTAIILDNTSKTILYEKNPQFRFSMASTTKIMTALIGLEAYKSTDILTVKRAKVEGVTVGFRVGEQVRFSDMLYALLLPSGNDAAYVIADNYPGGVAAFVLAMNNKLAELGLENTHYGDPAGLEDDQDFTTVKDLARLTSVVISKPELAKVIGTKEMTISNVAGTKQYVFANLNKLLGVNGVTGVKTGTTEGAGEVLITSKVEAGRTYIVIVMKSEDRFADTEQLLNMISNNIMLITPQYPFLPTVQ